MRNFGPYTNLIEIGRGGMASVYRATAPDGNLVALKLLPVHLAADRTARTRFEQESNLGLSHPNIVRAQKYGVEGDTPYIEMEYVAGESLDRLIARAGPLSPAEFAPLLIDAGRALDYAHERGVIHRDVKPSNIIVRPDGHTLLADFGVAKAMGMTAYTATTARVGSVFFMSPEQASGVFEVTKSSDIYSLGVTAYYALTGRVPFDAGSDIAVARQHVDQEPRHVSDVRPSIPRAVGDVVMWALEKPIHRRPPSAGAFARGFITAVTAPSAPSPVPPKPTPQPAPRPVAPAQPRPRPAPPTGTLSHLSTSQLAKSSLPTLEEELERRGRTPRLLWVGSIAAMVGVSGTLLAALLFDNPDGQGVGRATPTVEQGRNDGQPSLSVFTMQQTATLEPTQELPATMSVPGQALPLASSTPLSRPILIAPPTLAPTEAPIQPTRVVLPTRGPIAPITPLAPIAPIVTAAPLPPSAIPSATASPVPTDTPSSPPSTATLAPTSPPPPTDTPAPPAAITAPAIIAVTASP